jgi:hypothetical protein
MWHFVTVWAVCNISRKRSAFKMSGTPCTVAQHHITKDRNSSNTTVATSNLTSFMFLFICGLLNVSTSGCVVSKDDIISKQWMWKDVEGSIHRLVGINSHESAWRETMKLCNKDDLFLGTESNEFLSARVNTTFKMTTAPVTHFNCCTDVTRLTRIYAHFVKFN